MSEYDSCQEFAAKIDEDNEASLNLFRNLGFHEVNIYLTS